MSTRRRQRGFTLVEALVAVTLLALLFGAIMPAFQQGLAVLERGDRRTRAVTLAQGLLEQHAAPADPTGEDASPAELAGDDEGFSWQVLREPYAIDDGGPALDPDRFTGYRLTRITAAVHWDDPATGVRLSTLLLEREP